VLCARDGHDPLDPRFWEMEVPWRTIWLCPWRNLYTIVDVADYEWAKDNLWLPTRSKTVGKFYATRSTNVAGKRGTIYLHKDVLMRAVGKPPSPDHTIGDHLNGWSLDNRRCNLRWATPSENAANKHGIAWRQTRLDL
jgi:hypothetical protein